MQNVVPVGVCQALTLALGNAAYLYLTVSFIQMLKVRVYMRVFEDLLVRNQRRQARVVGSL